jgi:hypothetical protein
MGDRELAQIIAYLAATQTPVGLLINFGRRRLEYKRILATKTMQNWESAIEPYL